jgi:hypothetical protein
VSYRLPVVFRVYFDNTTKPTLPYFAIRCRWIRLTDVGERRGYHWAIDELKVREPPHWIPPCVRAAAAAGRSPSIRRPRAGRPVAASREARTRRGAASLPRLARRVDDRPRRFDRGLPRRSAGGRAPRPADRSRLRERDLLGDFVLLGGLRLDTDDLERRAPSHWQYDAKNETASIDLGATAEVSGVVVEHRDAASSFPRALMTRTSTDGERWSDLEPLTARPPALFWSGEGLLGASLKARVFLFPEPRSIRFLELSAFPRQPTFPWVLRSVTVLVPHGDQSSNLSG